MGKQMVNGKQRNRFSNSLLLKELKTNESSDCRDYSCMDDSIGSPGKFVPIFEEFDRHER